MKALLCFRAPRSWKWNLHFCTALSFCTTAQLSFHKDNPFFIFLVKCLDKNLNSIMNLNAMPFDFCIVTNRFCRLEDNRLCTRNFLHKLMRWFWITFLVAIYCSNLKLIPGSGLLFSYQDDFWLKKEKFNRKGGNCC